MAINNLYLFTLIKKTQTTKRKKESLTFLLTYLTHEVICKFF